MEAGLADEVVIYFGARLAGGIGRPLFDSAFATLGDATPLEIIDVAKLGPDLRVTAKEVVAKANVVIRVTKVNVVKASAVKVRRKKASAVKANVVTKATKVAKVNAAKVSAATNQCLMEIKHDFLLPRTGIRIGSAASLYRLARRIHP